MNIGRFSKLEQSIWIRDVTPEQIITVTFLSYLAKLYKDG